MTTIGEQLAIQGFQALLGIHGRLLTTPKGQFTALLQTDAQINPDAPLGDDPREFVWAYFLKTTAPALNHSDTITESLSDGSVLTYRVRQRESAPGEPCVKYRLEKIE